MASTITTAFSFEVLRYKNTYQILSSYNYCSQDGFAEKAFISSEGEWRVRYDGGEPTLTEGHLLRDGSFFTLHGELQMRNFKAISLNTESVLSISYERQ